MTALPSGSAPVWVIQGDDALGKETDVLSLAGQPLPGDGAWLLVTAAEPQPGGELAARLLPARGPVAGGGDVLVRVRPAGERDGGTAAARVQVLAVAAGSLVRVAGWDLAGLLAWPELVGDPVVFAMGALGELEQHGADLADGHWVEVTGEVGADPAGFPSLPTRVSLGR